MTISAVDRKFFPLEDDNTHNCLIFWAVYSYFKKIANSDHISFQKLKGLPDKSIKPPPASNNGSVLEYSSVNTNF